MPKERVKHGKVFAVIPTPGAKSSDAPGDPVRIEELTPGVDYPKGTTTRQEPSLDVSWNRDGGWVQIGFMAPPDWWDRFNADRLPESEYGAYTDILTRQEINHLIRTLRRARDAAYGSDE